MAFFEQVGSSPLYLASGGDPGWLAFVLPRNAQPPYPQGGIELNRALTDRSLSGSLVFASRAPAVTDPVAVAAQINAVLWPLPASRYIVWLRDPDSIAAATVATMGMTADGSAVSGGLAAPLVQHAGSVALALQVPNTATLTQTPPATGTDLALGMKSGAATVSFTGTSAPQANQTRQITSATLHLAGPHRGCFDFATVLQRQFLHDGFSWGLQFVMPSNGRAVAEWLPLAHGDLPSPTDMIAFAALIDPADPLNASQAASGSLPTRTALTFADGVELCSYYSTTAGAGVTLVPVPGPVDAAPTAARLVFTLGITDAAGGQQFQAAPAGDFVLTVDGAQAGTVEELLCALDATEHIGFRPQVDGEHAGDRLRFLPYRPAYVPVYPPKAASPVGPPVASTAALDGRYLTSWVTAVAADTSGSLSYVAQPRGASLYGRDQVVAPAHPDLIGPVDLAVTIADGGPEYPLAPYAGVSGQGDATAMTADQITGVEQSVLAPLRRAALARGSTGLAASKLAAAGLDGTTTVPPTTTTPAGLLVTLNQDASWQQVLLGQNTLPSGGALKLCFCNPGDELHQALQTNGLFLVAANASNLGAPAQGDGTCGTAAAFFNEINVDAWRLRADVGANTPGDYRNVLIVKARKGTLVDLVARPEAWTQAEDFAWPSDSAGGAGNEQELPALSAWLQAYVADAIAQARAGTADAVYFQDFRTLAEDPDWTGILVLRATIADLPAELAGITAGVSSPSRFEAHHFGVNVSQVELQDGAPQVTGPSSIFGLIFYVDPDLVGPPPVPPNPGVDYAFRLLELKALFENTAVKRFESRAQLTLNTLLGMSVTAMGGAAANPFNTLVLSGSFQSAGGQGVYSLSTDTDATFQFGSNIVTKIELTGAEMVTRSLGPPVVSAFGLAGFVDFAVVQGDDEATKPFDVLSFGSPPGSPDMLRQGLSFSDLDLVMTAGTGGKDATLVPDIGGIRFDVATSTPRDSSLFRQFALTLEALESGDKDHAPSAAGYLPVITDVTLTGVDGSPWFGLRYELDMGSPGRLAGSVGLTSTLLIAWTPTSGGKTYDALVGLQLPGTAGGAELLSLENVLKLSIGQLSLTLDPGEESRPGGFVLMLTEIALKFLGLLKIPPSGATSFYLFGDPAPGAGPSGLGWYAQYAQDQPKQEALP